MPPPIEVTLGPLTKSLLEKSTWTEANEYPAHQTWADECERLLQFLEDQGVRERFWPRLTTAEWQGAFAEARVGHFLHEAGFKIIAWEPDAGTGKPGNLEVQWSECEPIFVEVKGPGWEGELTKEEIQSGRTKQPKYINAEARAIDPTERVMFAVKEGATEILDDSHQCF